MTSSSGGKPALQSPAAGMNPGNNVPNISPAPSSLPQAGIAPAPRILLVEDDAAAARAMTDLLRLFGCSVTRAKDVATSIDALADARGNPFDFVLLDLMLPDGEGTTVLKAIRADNLPSKVAVISATADTSLLARVNAHGPDIFLRKPLDFGKLLAFMNLRRTH